MNKIVELVINLAEFEFEDLGAEIISLVDKPAIEVNWMAFNAEEDALFQEHILKVASEVGETIDPEEVVYVNANKDLFASVGDFLSGAKALDILGNLPLDTPAVEKFRYTGPAGQRTFCATLKALNRVYSREDISAMNNFNPSFGPGGSNSYSVFKYKGGTNCQHYWEQLFQFNNGTKNVLVSIGPAAGEAGQSNNDNDKSPTGSVANNASLKFWSFSEDDQQIVTGPAMIPKQLIARKDELGNLFHVYFSTETIQKIANKFLADNNTHNTDINHDGKVVSENTLLESWIVEDPELDKAKALGFNVPKGTWMTSYKINNKDTWKKIKAGELNGFSIEGAFLEVAQN